MAEKSPSISSGVTRTNVETLVLQCKTTIRVVKFFLTGHSHCHTAFQPNVINTEAEDILSLATMCSEARWLPQDIILPVGASVLHVLRN